MRFLPLLLVLSVPALAAPEDRTLAERFLDQERTAFRHFEKEEWVQAVAAFEGQIAIFHQNPRPYYNIACCYALQGDAERAATWLRLAIQQGWRDAEWLAKDTDFDQVRQSPAYRRVAAELEQVRRADPDPLPRRIEPESVPAVSSVRQLLTASLIQQELLAPTRDLWGRHEYRKRLFQLYDRRMAMLTRYIIENGDAPDAAEAAWARVETATRYLAAATEENAADRRLREVASQYILALAEEFERGYAGSPLLPQVKLMRASALRQLAGREADAEQALRGLLADHPDSEAAGAAQVQLCALLADLDRRDDLKREYAALEKRWMGQEDIDRMARVMLGKARLYAQGLPYLPELRITPPDGLALYVFVIAGDPACEARLKTLRPLAIERKIPTFLVCIGPPDAETDVWLAEHAQGLTLRPDGRAAIERLWLTDVPFVVAARGRDVLAIDPDDAALLKLVPAR